MNTARARRESLELMDSAGAAIVTTIDSGGFPQTRAMFNLHNRVQFPALKDFFLGADDFSVYLTTNTSSSKVSQIAENPRVSVYYCDVPEFRGLLLSGEMEIVADRAVREALWQEEWMMYYPGGADDPDHTVLRLRPIAARYYHRLNFCNFDPRKQ